MVFCIQMQNSSYYCCQKGRNQLVTANFNFRNQPASHLHSQQPFHRLKLTIFVPLPFLLILANNAQMFQPILDSRKFDLGVKLKVSKSLQRQSKKKGFFTFLDFLSEPFLSPHSGGVQCKLRNKLALVRMHNASRPSCKYCQKNRLLQMLERRSFKFSVTKV